MSVHQANRCDDIPLPIVKLNRWLLLVGILGGLVLGQPLFTTALLLVLLPAVLWGQRASLVVYVGSWLFAAQIPTAEVEDRRLMRFNNSIAIVLLALAQVAFLAGMPALGWGLALAVALAASLALLGFCVGCFLYYQFKLNRYRIFGY